MQSESIESLLKKNFKAILVLLIAVVLISLILSRNLFFKSTYLLKSFGELSIDPEIAFKNNKPTFLEFYAEWCEVCKEMAPKVSTLKDEYEKDINFVFLNVDNPKWDKYVKNLNVNGIPHVNLFDENANLISTLIGLQEEDLIEHSLNTLLKKEITYGDFISSDISDIPTSSNVKIGPRTHG